MRFNLAGEDGEKSRDASPIRRHRSSSCVAGRVPISFNFWSWYFYLEKKENMMFTRLEGKNLPHVIRFLEEDAPLRKNSFKVGEFRERHASNAGGEMAHIAIGEKKPGTSRCGEGEKGLQDSCGKENHHPQELPRKKGERGVLKGGGRNFLLAQGEGSFPSSKRKKRLSPT